MTLRKYALLPLLCLLGFAAGWAQNQTVNQKKTTKEKETMEKQQTNVRFINRAPAGYSHVVEVKGGRTLYIAGQIALDKDGNLVGRGDFRAQVKQVFENLKARLEEGGASFKDVVKLNYYLTDASDLQALRDTRNSYINTENPPASTLVVVKQLVREEYLVEIEAVAVVGECKRNQAGGAKDGPRSHWPGDDGPRHGAKPTAGRPSPHHLQPHAQPGGRTAIGRRADRGNSG